MSEQSVTTAAPGDLAWRYFLPTRTDSKMLLLTKGDTATIGQWQGELGQYFKAWCPLPKRDKALERELFRRD